MRLTKYTFIGIVFSSFVSCQSIEGSIRIGNMVIEKIEEFRSNTGHYPDEIYGLASNNDFWNIPQERIDSLVSGKRYSIYVIKGQGLWFAINPESTNNNVSAFEIKREVYCYEKTDSTHFDLWFGTVLGESVIYSSETNKWKDTNNP